MSTNTVKVSAKCVSISAKAGKEPAGPVPVPAWSVSSASCLGKEGKNHGVRVAERRWKLWVNKRLQPNQKVLPHGGDTVSKNTRPKWGIERTVAHAKEARALGQEHLADLQPRLAAGLMDGFAADLAHLEALQTGRPAKIDEVKGLTGSQGDLAEKGAQWAADIRETVRRRSSGEGLRKAVGVGRSVQAARAKSVATAIEAILTAAGERPDEVRACGILESDLTRGKALLASLNGASTIQDDGMIQKKDLTHAKDTTQIRVEAAIEAIATAGLLQYRDANPALAQRFRALIPPSKGNGGPGNAGGDPPAPPDAAKN